MKTTREWLTRYQSVIIRPKVHFVPGLSFKLYEGKVYDTLCSSIVFYICNWIGC